MNEDRIPDRDNIDKTGVTVREGRDVRLEENILL